MTDQYSLTLPKIKAIFEIFSNFSSNTCWVREFHFTGALRGLRNPERRIYSIKTMDGDIFFMSKLGNSINSFPMTEVADSKINKNKYVFDNMSETWTLKRVTKKAWDSLDQ